MRSLLTVFLTLHCLINAAAAQDWPQFRGPAGQGIADVRGVPSEWSEQENITWKVPIAGLGWSSPVVDERLVWLTTAVPEEGSLRVMAIDRAGGKTVHDIEVFREADLGRVNAKNSYASPTPVLDGKFVFVHFGNYGTACLTTSGKIVWSRKLEYDHRHGPGGSPVVWGDLLIVSCDGTDVQYTVALDKKTGDVRWKSEHPGQQAYSTPLVIEVDGQPQLITSGGDNLIAYAPRDGRELWRCRHGGHSVIPRPVYDNGLLYFCTGYWSPLLMAVRTGGSGDITDSHVAFTAKRAIPHTPSPLVAAGRLYMISDQGVLTCLDATSGKEIWKQRLGGTFSASPTLADGKLYLVNENGTTFVVAPGNKYKLLAENHLDGRTFASPAFVGRSIYLRSDTHLYRIEAPRTVTAGAVMSRRDDGRVVR